MRILDRYIRSNVIWSTTLVVFTLLGIETFIEFIGELSSLGTHNYGILAVFTYVALQLPMDLYQLFPVAGFIGSLIGLGRLASTSELIVMRAAGVSIARIAWAVVKAALWMLVIVTLIGEWQAPSWQYQSIQMKEAKLMRKTNLWSNQGLWLHQGSAFLHVGSVLSNHEVLDISRFDFDRENHLTDSLSARRGVLIKGVWQLIDVDQTQLTENQSSVHHYQQMPLGFSFQPQLLQKKMQSDSDQQSIASLWKNIQYRQQAGLLSNDLKSAFWQRAMQPLTSIVMICLGVPFIFGSLRTASMSARVLTGIIVGFSFYMLNQFLGPIALVYQWPPWIAGASPTLLFLLIFAILVMRIR